MMDTRLAPHCLGQAASFFPTSTHCKRCEYGVDCAQKVMTRLEEINQELDVSDIMRATQSFLDKNGVHTKAIASGASKLRFASYLPIEFDIDTDLSNCSVRAGKIAKAILRRGIDIKSDIKRGENHLKDLKPEYLYSVQEHLSRHGKITHPELKNIIREEKPNSKETAVSNSASWTAQALIAIGVIEKIGDDYVLTD
ncbi:MULTISPECIES: hypothetical protein [Vibrio harveyi group]|nr:MULTISPECIES: hypothetical protein [Vibrio harveyi group]MBS9810603.1 hypothetical protein [Vibrio alginolyticus]